MHSYIRQSCYLHALTALSLVLDTQPSCHRFLPDWHFVVLGTAAHCDVQSGTNFLTFRLSSETPVRFSRATWRNILEHSINSLKCPTDNIVARAVSRPSLAAEAVSISGQYSGGLIVDKVALGQAVSIIAPEFRTHLFLYHRRYMIIIITTTSLFFSSSPPPPLSFRPGLGHDLSMRCTPTRPPAVYRLTASTSLFTFALPFDAQTLTASLNKPQMNEG